MKVGKDELEKSLNSNLNTNKAKNIIIFIGDGMNLPTVTAARIYKAQYEARKLKKRVNGEESHLTFETFPNVALSKARVIIIMPSILIIVSYWLIISNCSYPKQWKVIGVTPKFLSSQGRPCPFQVSISHPAIKKLYLSRV